jgi:hypothetical protein
MVAAAAPPDSELSTSASVSAGLPVAYLQMRAVIRRLRPQRSWFFAVFAILATTAQFVVALAPLAEGRVTRTLSAHVESGGSRTHVAHNEATCASCQARSIQGTTSRPVFDLPDVSLAAAVTVAAVDRAASSHLSPHANPRAPPSVI